MSSSICIDLDQSKILSNGNGLTLFPPPPKKKKKKRKEKEKKSFRKHLWARNRKLKDD